MELLPFDHSALRTDEGVYGIFWMAQLLDTKLGKVAMTFKCELKHYADHKKFGDACWIKAKKNGFSYEGITGRFQLSLDTIPKKVRKPHQQKINDHVTRIQH